MISSKSVKLFCNEDFSLIENYDKAIYDTTQVWHCHHRRETDDGLSVKQLKELGLYYHRPANELIFLTKTGHGQLHNKGRIYYNKSLFSSEESKRKILDLLKSLNYNKRKNSIILNKFITNLKHDQN